ncbi:MAG: hypothetical protein IPF53_03835 [Blastocatellia bacterium]|nr:hypothetical protein [Blastocatellia bacterium]
MDCWSRHRPPQSRSNCRSEPTPRPTDSRRILSIASWQTSGGLCRLNPRREAGAPLFVVERLGDGSTSNEINCLLETRDGSLWCGTNGGPYRLVEEDGRWTASRVELGTDYSVTALEAVEPRSGRRRRAVVAHFATALTDRCEVVVLHSRRLRLRAARRQNPGKSDERNE